MSTKGKGKDSTKLLLDSSGMSHILSPKHKLLKHAKSTFEHNQSKLIAAGSHRTELVKKGYIILWFNPPPYLVNRPEAWKLGFDTCAFNNCTMTSDHSYVLESEAVLLDGRRLRRRPFFKRPPGQIWVFVAHESPLKYDNNGHAWRNSFLRGEFNWTMTYNRHNTDIYYPYGELRKHPNYVDRDYRAIALKKSRGALLITSNCNTTSKREKYVAELKRYYAVDVLGDCFGTPWNCGTRHVHDECFDLLNETYKFYLAFENGLCHQYFTEKFFENYNYDIILVVRGGSYGEAARRFPMHTIISADSFDSPKALGEYLARLSWDIDGIVEVQKSVLFHRVCDSVSEGVMWGMWTDASSG